MFYYERGNNMLYRNFGKTGQKISLLGFGAMRLPTTTLNGKTAFDYDESARIIRRAYDMGVNYFDSAPYYCDSESEIILGKALKGFRNNVMVSTKNPIEDDSGENFRGRLEKSLKNLDTSYIDFYHMWGINWETYTDSIMKKDGPMDAALKAKSEGLIKHISFSFHDEAQNLKKIIDTDSFDTMLVQYNLLDRSNEEAIAHAKSKGLGVVVMGPVGGGRLGAPTNAIKKLMPGKIISSAELALRFVMSNPNVDCALSGMGSMQMVEENALIASNNSVLSDDEILRINASVEENKKIADLYCTGCNYCMPCPYDVNIPLIFQLMNYHRVYGITDFARGEYQMIGEVEWMSGKKASFCTECGVCEVKCPQKIEIRKQLRETAAILE